MNNEQNQSIKRCGCWAKLCQLVQCKFIFLERVVEPVNLLVIRFWMGLIFLRSADTKVTGEGLFGLPETVSFLGVQFPLIPLPYQVTDTAYMLFEYEYNVPYLSPEFAALSATFFEIIFAWMLFVGLGGRIAAFGLLFMTLVMHLTYQAHDLHYLWMLLLMVVVSRGSGCLSLDSWVRRQFNKVCVQCGKN